MEDGTNRQTKQMKTNKGQRQREMKNRQNRQKIDKTMADGDRINSNISKIIKNFLHINNMTWQQNF